MIHRSEKRGKGGGVGCVPTEYRLLYISSAGGGLGLKCMWHHFNSLSISPIFVLCLPTVPSQRNPGKNGVPNAVSAAFHFCNSKILVNSLPVSRGI